MNEAEKSLTGLDPAVKRFVDARMELEELMQEEAACLARCAELADPAGTLDAASRPSERRASYARLWEVQRKVDTQYAFVCAVYESLNDTLSALVEPPKRPARP